MIHSYTQNRKEKHRAVVVVVQHKVVVVLSLAELVDSSRPRGQGGRTNEGQANKISIRARGGKLQNVVLLFPAAPDQDM